MTEGKQEEEAKRVSLRVEGQGFGKGNLQILDDGLTEEFIVKVTV